MKENIKNTSIQNVLLAIIAFLLSLNGYFLKSGNDRAANFQTKTIDTFKTMNEKLTRLETWTKTVYNSEISQNTKRSVANKNDITLLKDRLCVTNNTIYHD